MHGQVIPWPCEEGVGYTAEPKTRPDKRADELLASQWPSPAACVGANVLIILSLESTSKGQERLPPLGQRGSPYSSPGHSQWRGHSTPSFSDAGKQHSSWQLRVISFGLIGVRPGATGLLRWWEGSSCPTGQAPPAQSQAAPGQLGPDPPRLIPRLGGRRIR